MQSYATEIRVVTAALSCVAGVAERLEVRHAVGPAFVAGNDVIDFERFVFGGNAA